MRRGRADGRSPWARLLRDRRAVVCLAILAAELLAVLLLPPLLGLDPYTRDPAAGFWAPPSAAHPLGTDDAGRDLLARLVYGGRVSLAVGLCSAALSALVGVPLGLLAGYRRGAWEFWLMRLADVLQSFPSIVLVLCLVTLVGPSAVNLVLVLGLLGWTDIARLVYGNTLSVREEGDWLAMDRRARDTGETVTLWCPRQSVAYWSWTARVELEDLSALTPADLPAWFAPVFRELSGEDEM